MISGSTFVVVESPTTVPVVGLPSSAITAATNPSIAPLQVSNGGNIVGVEGVVMAALGIWTLWACDFGF